MPALGVIIGIYAYSFFILGLVGLLYSPLIILFTFVFFGVIGFFYRRRILAVDVNRLIRQFGINLKDKVTLVLFLVLGIQAFVNLIGVLGPELGFDALWYHLTLPKLYLVSHNITFFPGGLLYYSAMPKLLELLYVGGLSFGSEIYPKLTHFGFGILILLLLYKISRKFLSKNLSLLALVIFYSNLVVGWESISAYIDLGRTFFELLSFFMFLEWVEKKNKKYFFLSAVFLGFAITSKLLALCSLLIMLILIYRQSRRIKSLFSYAVITLIIPLPWLVFSFINTGNPIYPFFTHTYPIGIPFYLLNPLYLLNSIWSLFLFSPDPVNPIYLIVIPIIIQTFKKWEKRIKPVFYFSIAGLILWYITPQTGGGRFIIPYLPMFSIVTLIGITSLKVINLKKMLFVICIAVAIGSIGYRAIANAKFIPVVLGKETRILFLTKHLNFNFGDFIDSDGYFKNHIKENDKVLLFGFHNLYYIDFPFIDSSWIKKGDSFDYIATQNSRLPNRFKYWTMVYTNPVTHVSLYKAGEIRWIY